MSVDVEAAAVVGFSLGDVTSAVKDGLRGRPKPIRKPIIGQSDAAAGGAGATVCSVGGDGPATGRIWDLRNICITGVDDHTAGAFPGAVYVGNVSGLSPVDFGIGTIVDTIPSVPFSETYSQGEVTINHGDRLFVVLYNVTAGVQFTVTARIDEWLSADVVASMI